MKCLLNKKGSILAVNLLVVFLLVCTVLWIDNIFIAGSSLIEKQNKKDAHTLSVLGLYADTMDEVSWANKQLQKITLLSSMLVFTPQLSGLIKMLDIVCKGLQEYQDFLLLRLKVYAPVLDRTLRQQNDLPVLGGLHYVTHRRQPNVDLFFISIPGLIEFKDNVFKTACVDHKGRLISVIGCLYSKEYSYQQDNWFAPTKSTWQVKIRNAY